MPDPLVGQLIEGRYQVTSHLADGGMGRVYVAHDTRLERDVALKVLRTDLARDPVFVSRFQREARAAARLSHPHVVAVFDVVADSDTDHRWLVMEYVDGVDLGRLVRERGPLSPDDAAPLLWQAADALAQSGAKEIRWIRPGGVVTMDYRVDRLNARLDKRGRVREFTCG